MKNKINLTKQDVKNVAEALMKVNESTTTLDIKKELRDNDYFATQEAVADFMYEILDETDWTFSFNGTYRTYYLDDSNMPEDDQDQDDTNVNLDDLTVKTNLSNSDFWKFVNDEEDEKDNTDLFNDTDQKMNLRQDLAGLDDIDGALKLRNGKIIVPLDENNLPDCYWKVSSSITNKIFCFSNGLNREEVRYAYYKLADIKKGSNYRADKINF